MAKYCPRDGRWVTSATHGFIFIPRKLFSISVVLIKSQLTGGNPARSPFSICFESNLEFNSIHLSKNASEVGLVENEVSCLKSLLICSSYCSSHFSF